MFSNAAYKSAIREQKLALEISAAKRERDFYLNKVDQSRAQSAIEERIKKVRQVAHFFNISHQWSLSNLSYFYCVRLLE